MTQRRIHKPWTTHELRDLVDTVERARTKKDGFELAAQLHDRSVCTVRQTYYNHIGPVRESRITSSKTGVT